MYAITGSRDSLRGVPLGYPKNVHFHLSVLTPGKDQWMYHWTDNSEQALEGINILLTEDDWFTDDYIWHSSK